MKEKTTKDRLLEYLAHIEVGQTIFEKKVGISNGYINNLKGAIGPQIMGKISKSCPDLNTDWLLTGRGTMLINAKDSKSHFPKQLELDFTSIVAANTQMADAVQIIARSNEKLATTNEKLTDTNGKMYDDCRELIKKLSVSLERIEDKLDKKGAVDTVRNVALKEEQG